MNIVGGCCGTTPAHIAAIAEAVRGGRPCGAPARVRHHPALRARAVRDHRRHRLRDDWRADQRHRLGQVPAAHRGRRLPGGGERRPRPGAQRRQPARREHGRGPARERAGDDHVPEPGRDRARGRPHPGDGRQLQVDRARGRAEVRPGQGRRQLDQPEGRRGGLPRPRRQDQGLRRRRGGDGVRRARTGGHHRTEGGDLRPRLRLAHAAGRIRAGRHHLRPERARRGDRDRRAQRVREVLHRGAAADQGALPRCPHQRRHLQPVVRLPRQRGGAPGHARRVPLPRDPGRARHGHRQRRPARRVRGHQPGAEGTGRGRPVRPAGGRHRPARQPTPSG